MIKKWMCVDVETTGLDWWDDRLHGIGVSYEEGEAAYYPAWDVPQKIVDDLADPSIAKIGHNFHAFDAKVLHRAGYKIGGEFHDTMIVANLLDPDMDLGLKYLSDRFLGEDSLQSKRELDRYIGIHKAGHIGGLCSKDLVDPEHPHTAIIAKYCIEDVNNTASLYFKLMGKLHEQDVKIKAKLKGHKSPLDHFYEEAMPLERVLFEMECRGIRIDLKVIQELHDKAVSAMRALELQLTATFSAKMVEVEDDLVARERDKVSTEAAKAKRVRGQGKCAFQWGNVNHVAAMLLKCPSAAPHINKTNKGRPQLDKAAIERLVGVLPNNWKAALRLYSQYRLHMKVASTYTGTADKGIMSKIKTVNGVPRIFPSYRQTTGTGRLACKNPNMQNLKRDSDVKKMFIPDNEDEVFDDVDYSQIELRTGAHVSSDAALCSAYRTGGDVHLRTASVLFKRNITKQDDVERQAGKRTNFLTIFDGGAFRLQASLKADTGKHFEIEECEEFIRLWFAEYGDVRKYLDEQLKFFKLHGWCISETGRIRRLPDIHILSNFEWKSSKAVFKGTNILKAELIAAAIKKLGKDVIINDQLLYSMAKKRYNHAVKAGYNQPIQGLAASLSKRAMIALYNRGILPSNQVHDSLVVARKEWDLEATKTLVDVLTNIYPLRVPIEVDVKCLKSFHPKDIANGLQRISAGEESAA